MGRCAGEMRILTLLSPRAHFGYHWTVLRSDASNEKRNIRPPPRGQISGGRIYTSTATAAATTLRIQPARRTGLLPRQRRNASRLLPSQITMRLSTFLQRMQPPRNQVELFSCRRWSCLLRRATCYATCRVSTPCSLLQQAQCWGPQHSEFELDARYGRVLGPPPKGGWFWCAGPC